MTRSDLDLTAMVAPEPGLRSDRAAWLRACFAPAESIIDTVAAEDSEDPGWRPIAFWWPTSVGVQLVLMPCRSVVQ